jgi:hypothetical protein
VANSRDGETDGFGGSEVDGELVFGRRLDWQVRRLLAPENAVDVAGSLPVLVDEIRSIRDQAAGGVMIRLR